MCRSTRRSRAIALVVLASLLSLVSACGGASAGTHILDGTGPITLLRFEPDLITARGNGDFRILGDGFGRRGDEVTVRFTASEGTPFHGGTSPVFEAAGVIESRHQIRGNTPSAGIPRHVVAHVVAAFEVVHPRGSHSGGGDLRAVFEPTPLRLDHITPVELNGVSPAPSSLIGSGFDPNGSAVQIEFSAASGTPFDGSNTAIVFGTVISSTQIDFDSPTVGRFDYGSHAADVLVTLFDGAQVRNEDFVARINGPTPPPPFRVATTLPSHFTSRRPQVFQIQGTDFTPVGGVARIRFTVDTGTPFNGSNAVEVMAVIESSVSMRGLSPAVPTITAPVTTSLTVTLPDTRADTLGAAAVTFVPLVGTPRLVINEVDYDQVGTDAAEFVEIFNAGDGAAALDEYALELVNGTGGGASTYSSIDLPDGVLAARAYFVISGDSANVPNTDLDVSPDVNWIQNGAPDALGLRRNGAIIDALSYEGDAGSPYVEGSGAGLSDVLLSGDRVSVARFIDGFDSDQNNVDFEATSPATPGEPNRGPGELPFAGIFDGTVAEIGDLIVWSALTGRGGMLGNVVPTGGISGLDFFADGTLVAVDHDTDSNLLYLDPRDGSTIWDVGIINADGAPLRIIDISIHPNTSAIYALDDATAGSGSLFTIDPVRAQATRIGNTPLGAFERNGGLAFDASGTLYMTARSGTDRLLTINATDATQVSTVAIVGASDSLALSVRPFDGTIYLANAGAGALYTLTPAGTAARVAPTGVGTSGVGAVGAIAFQPK